MLLKRMVKCLDINEKKILAIFHITNIYIYIYIYIYIFIYLFIYLFLRHAQESI